MIHFKTKQGYGVANHEKRWNILKNIFIIFQDKVRSQDTVFVIGGVTGSVKGREMAWQFLKDNWTKLHDRYEGGFLLSRLVKVNTQSDAWYNSGYMKW